MEFVIAPENFKADQVMITPPKVTKRDGKSRFNAYLNYGKQRTMYPMTPELRSPFSVSDYEGNKDFKMQLSLEGADKWTAELRKIDAAMLEWGANNWENIPCFKKKPSQAIVEDKYKPIVKDPPEDKDYSPTIRCSFPMTKWFEGMKDEDDNLIDQKDFVSEPRFELYSDNNEKIEIKELSDLVTEIPAGSTVKLCFQLKIWSIAATGYGLSVSAVSLQVTKSNYAKPTGNIWQSVKAPVETEAVPDSDDENEDPGEAEDSGSGSASAEEDEEEDDSE